MIKTDFDSGLMRNSCHYWQ